ncbi:MAG TPA: Hsp20/alpha crystallin family protein [Bacillus bacterium]|nr:Hsp20/alpha crystallin family protein [Bacillus sp. (in: firmicutes)]
MNKKEENEFLPVLKDLNSIFNRFWDEPFASFFPQQFRVDLYDMGQKIVVEAELPGFSQNQIKIEAVHEGLKIMADDSQELETIDDNKKYFKKERSIRRLERIIPLPYEISADTKAYYKNGILEVHIPKRERRKQRNISIE